MLNPLVMFVMVIAFIHAFQKGIVCNNFSWVFCYVLITHSMPSIFKRNKAPSVQMAERHDRCEVQDYELFSSNMNGVWRVNSKCEEWPSITIELVEDD